MQLWIHDHNKLVKRNSQYENCLSGCVIKSGVLIGGPESSKLAFLNDK